MAYTDGHKAYMRILRQRGPLQTLGPKRLPYRFRVWGSTPEFTQKMPLSMQRMVPDSTEVMPREDKVRVQDCTGGQETPTEAGGTW